MKLATAAFLIAAAATLLPWETTAQVDCPTDIADLSPCYGFLEGRDFYPATDCCNRLENVIQTRPDCLCDVLRGGSGNGGSVNQTRFLELPSACGVQSPLLNCNYYTGGGTPPYFSNTPYGRYNPYYSGYSTKILNCMLLSVVIAVASCAQLFIVV